MSFLKKYKIIYLSFLLGIYSIYGIDDFTIDWRNGKIYSSYVISVQPTKDFPKKRLEALNSAKEKTKVNYFKILNNIYYSEFGETLYDYFENNPQKKSMLYTLIENSRLYKLEYLSVSDAKVTYTLDLYGEKNSLMSLILNDEKLFTEDLKPYIGYIYDIDFTGIIIDARGTQRSFDGKEVNIKPVLFVTVKDSDGKIVFNRYNVSSEVMIKKGMVLYSNNISEDFSSRVGNFPLKVVAMGVGDANGAVIVISNSDAKKILSSKKSRESIRNGNIVIVISSKL